MWNETMMASNFQNIPPSDRVLSNIELANILSGKSRQQFWHLTTFLTNRILKDSPDKSSSGKKQKRKATDDLWKSGGKRKVGTEDSELVETSSCDSTSRSTPISQETEVATPNSG